MRRWIAFFVGLFCLPGTAWGQDAPVLGGLASQPGWGRLAVVGGRLAVLNPPPRFEKRTSRTDEAQEISESICIRAAGNVAEVRYEFVSPEERVTVEAAGREHVEIHRTRFHEESPAELHLVQAPGRELVLTIGAGASRREFSGPTFWHLLLAEPELSRDCVIPLFEAFRSDWRLQQQAAEIESRLLEQAAIAPAPETASWQELVEQLGDRRFTRREAADRQLRAAGQPILPFLMQLDRRRLDAEQQARLAGIKEAFLGVGEDTPARVASRMVYDASTWLVLLTRDDARQRAVAARHLCKICPEAVVFDPQAEQPIRRAQLKQLRQQLAHD